MNKFAGLGLTNIICVWLLCCFLTAMSKVIFTKYEVAGVSKFFQSL